MDQCYKTENKDQEEKEKKTRYGSPEITELPNRVRALMREKGITSREMARALEISKSRMSQLLKTYRWTAEQIDIAADFLGTSREYIITGNHTSEEIINEIKKLIDQQKDQ